MSSEPSLGKSPTYVGVLASLFYIHGDWTKGRGAVLWMVPQVLEAVQMEGSLPLKLQWNFICHPRHTRVALPFSRLIFICCWWGILFHYSDKYYVFF